MEIHVYPQNDLALHELEGKECPCLPRVEEDGQLIVHNSWDRREVLEHLEEKYTALV